MRSTETLSLPGSDSSPNHLPILTSQAHAVQMTDSKMNTSNYRLPTLMSLDLPQPTPGQTAPGHQGSGNSHVSPIGGQPPRPPTSGQSFSSTHQIVNGNQPAYRTAADFNRLPSLAGVAASLSHTQSAPQQEQPREPNYSQQSSYDSSRILPPPVPRVQVNNSNNYAQQSTSTLPPLSATTVGSRDIAKYEEQPRQNPFHPTHVQLRPQQQYNASPASINGDAYQQEMTPSYSTTTLVQGRTPSQASTFAPSQRPMPAPSPESSSIYSPIAAMPVNKSDAWAGEDQYSYLSGTVNGVDQDPNEMDPAAIMQVVVNHCNAIVQFTAQYGAHRYFLIWSDPNDVPGATPRGTLQTPSPSPNAGFPQGIPEDKLSDMVNRAIAVVRLLRALSHRQAEQAKPSTKGMLDGLELDGTSNGDGENDGVGMRPGKRVKISPPGDSVDVDAPKPKYKKRSRAPPPSQCASCGISETPEWRKGPDGARTLCNACGLHFAKLSRNRERDVDNNGRPIRPPVNIEMLRNSVRATCQPTRVQTSAPAEQSTSSGSKSGGIQERTTQESTMPMVWEAPVAARPSNPYAASAVEQASMGQMHSSSYSSSATQQSPVDSLQGSGYGATVAQSPVSSLHTPTYTPTSHLQASAYPTPMSQTTDPLYQLAQAAAGNAVQWGPQASQPVLPQGSVSQAQGQTATAEHQYWQQQPQTSILANQMSNVRTDLPETSISPWSGMRMQQGAPMGYTQAPSGSNHQLQENTRVYG
ncbi:hypothetical protein CALVIDRAFT_270767 [Calocera viscosa TUFC12733]|uniref:GATA-type domain-containing protein n=1 Tax=Calocera viscosa (strain TUFC12733) TaxID=1330018 RepID=A0A167QX09_CALVF|nr:hypothetical protein CALVIDRAFT_270767 [Calocera viscosa TUFC12733]